jgi:hypothetical protein
MKRAGLYHVAETGISDKHERDREFDDAIKMKMQ